MENFEIKLTRKGDTVEYHHSEQLKFQDVKGVFRSLMNDDDYKKAIVFACLEAHFDGLVDMKKSIEETEKHLKDKL